MHRHILAAVSENPSDTALPIAIEKACRAGATLTVVHIVDPMPWWAVAGASYGCADGLLMVRRVEQEVMERCRDRLQQVAPELCASVVSMPLREGGVGRAIANAAKEFDADLIVLGTGRSSPWRFWRERVSDVIGRFTGCPVLIAASEVSNVRRGTGADLDADLDFVVGSSGVAVPRDSH